MAAPKRQTTREIISLRLDPDTLVRLSAQAAAQRVSRTTLVERYILEGMEHDAHPLIQFRERSGRRVAVVAGHRLEVRHVINLLHGCAGDQEQVARQLNLSMPLVEACVSFYVTHRDEMDAYAAHVDAENEALFRADLAASTVFTTR